MAITHTTVATAGEPAGGAEIGGNQWNANHTVSGGLPEAWPIGSVFISVVSTNPATLLGFGTWVAFGAGRVLVGLDSGDTDFDVVEEVGGAKTITLDTTMIPSHTHMQRRNAVTTGTAQGITTAPDLSSSGPANLGPVTEATGGGLAHSNVQPYVVVYMWRRTE